VAKKQGKRRTDDANQYKGTPQAQEGSINGGKAKVVRLYGEVSVL